MDKPTYDALLATIELWKRNKADPQSAIYTADANPLCQLFYTPPGHLARSDEEFCVGCPVSVATGDIKCRNTPYIFAREYIDAYRRAGCLRRDVVRYCDEHVQLLQSLVPDSPPNDIVE